MLWFTIIVEVLLVVSVGVNFWQHRKYNNLADELIVEKETLNRNRQHIRSMLWNLGNQIEKVRGAVWTICDDLEMDDDTRQAVIKLVLRNIK